MRVTRRGLALTVAGAVIVIAAGKAPFPGGIRRNVSQLKMVDPEYAPPQEPGELKRQRVEPLTKPEGRHPSIHRER
jgi:hypothetical protein